MPKIARSEQFFAFLFVRQRLDPEGDPEHVFVQCINKPCQLSTSDFHIPVAVSTVLPLNDSGREKGDILLFSLSSSKRLGLEATPVSECFNMNGLVF